MKEKRKITEKLTICLVMGIYMFIGVRSALISLKDDSKYSFPILTGLIVYMLVAAVFHVILHEGGHLIGGLATGYEFTSFRIGSLVWIKDKERKIRLKRMKVQGTGGQCLLRPPKVPIEECPYKWYHLSGGLMNIGIGIACILLYLFLLPKNYITYALFEEFGEIGIALGLANLIPCKFGGVQNDGYNLIELGKDMNAKKCTNIVLEINALLTMADSYADLPKELVEEIKAIDFTKMDITNVSIANALNYQAAMYFVEGNYDKAYELQKYILDTPGVLQIIRNEAKCECLFYEIVHTQNKEKVEELYDKELQQYVKATAIYPSRQRLLHAYYHLYMKDEKKANEAYEKLKKLVDTYMIKADALMELEVATNIKAK